MWNVWPQLPRVAALAAFAALAYCGSYCAAGVALAYGVLFLKPRP